MNAISTDNMRPDLLAVAELIKNKEKVLDLGCGDGALLRFLQDTRGVSGRGVELTEVGVFACVSKGVSVRQGNLHEGLGDYPNGSFDTVVLSQTLPFLNDPEFIIREMLRVGRRAIVSFANWGHWRCRLSLLLTGRFPMAADLPQDWYQAPRVRPLTVRDFGDFCQEYGFNIANQIFLRGDRRIAARRTKNLQATTAIFELR
jgi:methionine biosynthesis protein MetW